MIMILMTPVSPDGQGRPDSEHQPGGLPGQQRGTLPLRPAESQETDLNKHPLQSAASLIFYELFIVKFLNPNRES